jgi:hypothetical protein
LLAAIAGEDGVSRPVSVCRDGGLRLLQAPDQRTDEIYEQRVHHDNDPASPVVFPAFASLPAFCFVSFFIIVDSLRR